MTANHNEQKILTAIKNLEAQGVKEFTSQQVSKQAQKDAGQRFNLMPYRELYRVIGKLLKDGMIEFGSDGNHYKAVKL